MISKIKILVLFLLITACSDSKGQNSGSTNGNEISAEELINDIDTLQSWITRAHGDPYRFTTREKLDDQFNVARKRVLQEKQITSNAFAGVIMPIIAELRDGHAQVFLKDFDHVEGNVFFPLQFVFLNKVPYVIKNFSSEKIEIGSEITKINGTNAKDFFDEILPVLHRDGDIETVRYKRLQNPTYFARTLVALSKAKETYSITLKYEGKTSELNLKGLSQSEYSSKDVSPKSEFKALVYKKIDSLKSTALLDINSFNPFYYENNSFYNQVDEIVTSLNHHNIENLIIDLRNNIGGEDSYVMYLLRYLLNNEFVMQEVTFAQNNYKFLPDGRHYDIDPKCFKKNDKGSYDATEYLWEDHPTLGSFKPFDNRFKGKVIVLINGFTFSAASDFAASLHYHKRATFIGEETGGSYIGNVSGFIPTLRLPNSKVQVNLPLISLKTSFFESNFTNRGVLPDVEVNYSLSDILNSKDIVFEKALNYLN